MHTEHPHKLVTPTERHPVTDTLKSAGRTLAKIGFAALPVLFVAESAPVVPPFSDTPALEAEGANTSKGEVANVWDAEWNFPFDTEQSHDSYLPYGFIAHAFGTLEGQRYTNTMEAFNESYAKGFRVFEVDFIPLQDGTVIAAHDGQEEHYGLAPNQFRTATAADVQNVTFDGEYTVPFAQDIIDLLREHPDVTIIADTKWNLAETYATFAQLADYDPAVLDRLVPHVGTQDELDAMRAVYPDVQPMFALYRTQNTREGFTDDQAVEFVERNKINAVMMRSGLYDPNLTLQENNLAGNRYTPELAKRLRAASASVYVHSLIDIKDIAQFARQGIGVYSDGTIPQPQPARS